jgi:two-component system, response regulator PdtaR
MTSESADGHPPAVPAAASILCVDGSRSRLDHLSTGLRGAGFATLTAGDGKTAIALCAKARPALAIVNRVIPDGSGIEVARRLQEGGSLPVIFVVSAPDHAIVNEAAEAGAMSVLVEPVDHSHLLPAVRIALARHLELQHLHQRLQRLESLKDRRHETGVVVGLLMERLQIPSQEAFARLRRFARERNRRISDVVAEILRGSEDLLRVIRQIGDAHSAAAKGA